MATNRANPEAMTPHAPAKTRTAPPMTPEGWYSQPRMRTYLLFDATGVVYLLLGFVALRVVWALGEGPEAWASILQQLTHPLYIAFHLLGLVGVIFVGIRFFRLFPKAQPAKIGPATPPPAPVFFAGLYGAWVGLTVVFAAILAGVLF
jgi:fumarate reductase subunit C